LIWNDDFGNYFYVGRHYFFDARPRVDLKKNK
jgi:hypothetical protein